MASKSHDMLVQNGGMYVKISDNEIHDWHGFHVLPGHIRGQALLLRSRDNPEGCFAVCTYETRESRKYKDAITPYDYSNERIAIRVPVRVDNGYEGVQASYAWKRIIYVYRYLDKARTQENRFYHEIMKCIKASKYKQIGQPSVSEQVHSFYNPRLTSKNKFTRMGGMHIPSGAYGEDTYNCKGSYVGLPKVSIVTRNM